MNEFPKDLQNLAFKISEYRDILSFKITIINLCLFFCSAYRVFNIFLNSIYMC